MSLKAGLAAALVVVLVAPQAWAKKKDKDKKEKEEDTTEESNDDSGDDSAKADDASDDGGGEDGSGGEDEGGGGGKKKKKKAKKQEKSDEDGPAKQDLSGHDLGTNKKENLFEKDRFFVDKVDTEKTDNKTLVQGSLTSSSLFYTESGGTYGMQRGDNSARFARYYTDLRLQTDFRHISGGKWEGRIDARARIVPSESEDAMSADPIHPQSGFNGTNEYDLKELWLFHSGKRTDVFFGRQFIADLGAVKIDGLRIDYAQSRKVTLLGFAGLYPMRGSRSITTDYRELKDNEFNSAGKYVGAAGFGGAYRTVNSYGAIGGVALVPFKGESPRIFATSTGYYRSGATLDLYHFALIDLASATGAGVTNLSAGVNYKPNPRLRLTANFNRVDVDTLNVQANAYLNEPQQDPATGAPNVIQNETYLRRLATNAARGGISAALGQLQRFEVTVQAAYRFRPAVELETAGATGIAAMPVTLPAAKGVDLYGSITDRHSFKDMRLGLDVSRSFGVGSVSFQRSEVSGVRASAARELRNGHGEWEAEISYTTTKDSAGGISCTPGAGAMSVTTTPTCFGSSTGSILSLGGTLFYRINRDWLAIGSAFLTRQTLTAHDAAGAVTDPTVSGLMGFARLAYRF